MLDGGTFESILDLVSPSFLTPTFLKPLLLEGDPLLSLCPTAESAMSFCLYLGFRLDLASPTLGKLGKVVTSSGSGEDF